MLERGLLFAFVCPVLLVPGCRLELPGHGNIQNLAVELLMGADQF